MGSPSNALNISQPGLVYFDNVLNSFDGRLPTSSNNTITITVNPTTIDFVASASGDVQTLTGNSGVATPIGGTINVQTVNTTVKFVGTSGNLKQDFGLSNLLIGSPGTSISGAGGNVALGQSSLASLTSGGNNVCIGYFAGNKIASSSGSTLIGSGAGINMTSGTNTYVGIDCGGATTTGTNNCCFGNSCYTSGLTGQKNILIGTSTGANYSGAESSNIILGNVGTALESNVIRIGTQGAGVGQQSDCYLAGILHTTSGRTVNVTSPGAYPYTALITDYVILVDTSSGRTINLMASPTTGTTLVIKDNVGSAGSNNITITPAAGNIDGSASYSMNVNYGSATLIFNGTQWNVI